MKIIAFVTEVLLFKNAGLGSIPVTFHFFSLFEHKVEPEVKDCANLHLLVELIILDAGKCTASASVWKNCDIGTDLTGIAFSLNTRQLKQENFLSS